MNLRRLTLLVAMCMLLLCALAGAWTLAQHGSDEIGSVFAISIAVLIAAGIVFPLTFLVDRPKYRVGGIAAILLVLLVFLNLSGMFLLDVSRWLGPERFEIEDALSAMLGLSLLYGLPTVGALLLLQFRWAKISAWALLALTVLALGLVALAGTYRIMNPPPPRGVLMGRMAPAPARDFTAQFLLDSSFAVYGMGFVAVLLLVNVRCGDRRYFRFPAILLAAVALVLMVIGIWTPGSVGDAAARHAMAILLPAIFCAHLNLLLMAPSKGVVTPVRAGTLAASLLCVALLAAALVGHPASGDEGFLNASLAAGIFSMCGSLVLVMLPLMRKRFDYHEEKLSELLTHIDITCPRCQTSQKMPLGDSVCEGCGLRFSLKAIEPHCAECGYLLYGIKSGRCPECGAPIAGIKSAVSAAEPAIAPPPIAASPPA